MLQKPMKYLFAILQLITFASIIEGRSYPENVSPLHRRLARNEVYAVNALTYDDIPDGLRSEFSEDDVNETVEEVQRLLAEDPSLPRLTRAEILALFDNVTRAEKLENKAPTTIKQQSDSVGTTVIPDFDNLDKRGTVHRKQNNFQDTTKNEDNDEKIILESIGIIDKNSKSNNNNDNTRVVLLDENKNKNKDVLDDKETPGSATTDYKGVYVVLPDRTHQPEHSTFNYIKSSGEYESQTEHQDDSDDYITEFTDITKNSIKETTLKPEESTTFKDDQFHIDIEKLSELTSSSFEDKKSKDELNVNVNLGTKNEGRVKIFAQLPERGSIRYYDSASNTRHSNHKYSDEDITDEFMAKLKKGPIYLTTTKKPKPRFESTGRPFSVPTANQDDYVRFKPVQYISSPSTTTTTKTTTVAEEVITTNIKPITDAPIPLFTTQSLERLTLPSVRPETYAKFRPLPKVDPKLTEDMQSFLADFGLLPGSQNRVNRKLTTAAPKKPTNNNVFNPANTTRVSLEKLTQLLEAVKQLENINTTLTNKDLDSIADKLEALGIGSRDRSKLSSGPNPLSDRYNVDWNKNEIKRQQPNGTEEIFKLDLLGNSTSGDQLGDETESEPKVVNSTPSTTTTTTTTAKPNLQALEESFGAPIDPSTIDESLPPPRKNGLYFLVDWNSFLEVGEDGKDKVVIRFDPKVGDPSRFIPVTVP